MRVLIIEDGTEYLDLLSRFLVDIDWIRVGSGPEALAWLSRHEADALFLDMCFDRIPIEELLGDIAATALRFNGDPVRARSHLQQQQGLYILSALRGAGIELPVLLAIDLRDEPARWQRLRDRYAPVAQAADLTPGAVREALKVLTVQE